MNEKVETPEVKNVRSYDVAPPAAYVEFMRTGWAPSDLEGLQPLGFSIVVDDWVFNEEVACGYDCGSLFEI